MKNTYLIVVLIISTLTLVIYEFFGIYTARKKKLTKNWSRMVTHFIMAVLLIILLCIIIHFVIEYYRITGILF
ncbi:MAG: hypothetical protein N2Z73_00155 [Endomicrobia bacterium]|nr:hypothetical protein [Endomicrobiia bacterium]